MLKNMPDILPWQKHVYDYPARYRVVTGGRQTGKTDLALREVGRAANSVKRGCVILVTANSTLASIAWNRLVASVPWYYIERMHHPGMSMVIKTTGTEICVLDQKKAGSRLCGKNISFAAFDYAAYTPKNVWTDIVRPSLSEQNGRAIFLSVPDSTDNWFFDIYRAALKPENTDWYGYRITTADAGLVPASEIESMYNVSERASKIEGDAALDFSDVAAKETNGAR